MRASGVLEELSIRERDGVPCLRLTAAESAAALAALDETDAHFQPLAASS
jgi:hypothetical protein